MDARQLRILRELGELGSVSAVADLLHITPSGGGPGFGCRLQQVIDRILGQRLQPDEPTLQRHGRRHTAPLRSVDGRGRILVSLHGGDHMVVVETLTGCSSDLDDSAALVPGSS